VASRRVFPAASARNAEARIHVPFSLPLRNVVVAVIPDADVVAAKVATAF
jgi:hypothetical protein